MTAREKYRNCGNCITLVSVYSCSSNNNNSQVNSSIPIGLLKYGLK